MPKLFFSFIINWSISFTFVLFHCHKNLNIGINKYVIVVYVNDVDISDIRIIHNIGYRILPTV